MRVTDKIDAITNEFNFEVDPELPDIVGVLNEAKEYILRLEKDLVESNENTRKLKSENEKLVKDGETLIQEIYNRDHNDLLMRKRIGDLEKKIKELKK